MKIGFNQNITLATRIKEVLNAMNPQIEKFSVQDSSSAGAQWNIYVARFQNMLRAFKIEEDEQKKSMLLHFAGNELFEIHSTFTEEQKSAGFEDTIKYFNDYFNPRKNTEYHIHLFREAKQYEDETIDQFHTRLIQLAIPCQFVNKEAEIKSQIIQKCASQKLRIKALQETMTLQQLLVLARSIEVSIKQAIEMEERIDTTSSHVTKTISKKKEKSNKTCFRCGYEYPHKNNKCPAEGKTCAKCKKVNHFASVCRTKTRRAFKVTEDNDMSHEEDSDPEINTEII